MPPNRIVRYRQNNRVIPANNRPGYIAARNVARGIVRGAGRAIVRTGKRKAQTLISQHFNKARRLNNRWKVKHKYKKIVGNSSGTTKSTTTMLVKRTPREQKFLRKLFLNNPIKRKHVQRFGFNWVTSSDYNETIWYSVTHNKFNNICEYMHKVITNPTQYVGDDSGLYNADKSVGNGPDLLFYLGKCTYSYELYNPTNYNITIYIYDLVARKDIPKNILYSDMEHGLAPEVCMQLGFRSFGTLATTGWTISDPTSEETHPDPDPMTSAKWNTVGNKPTDSHCFNVLWKVKSVKKLILPPGTSHHHIVIHNPKKVFTKANLLYPHIEWTTAEKKGLAGITQATLFGFEGQVVGESEDTDVTGLNERVGTLPGKIIVKCIRKCNVYNLQLNTQTIINKNRLYKITDPQIFTDKMPYKAGTAAEVDEE